MSREKHVDLFLSPTSPNEPPHYIWTVTPHMRHERPHKPITTHIALSYSTTSLAKVGRATERVIKIGGSDFFSTHTFLPYVHFDIKFILYRYQI
jgi:hypothetical protein